MKDALIQQFRLVHMASQNGFYEIWDAENNLGQKASVKVLKSEFMNNPRVREEFKREAKQAASLLHPGISRILGLEESAGTLAIIRESNDGITLKEHLRKKGAVKEVDGLRMLLGLLETMNYIHMKGYQIGNLNYENVLVTQQSALKLFDFSKDTAEVLGFAAPVSSFGPEAISFKSPEQLQGLEAASNSGDLYSAGMILYSMIRGKAPFNPTDQPLANIYRDITNGVLPAIAMSDAGRQFLARLMHVNPGFRFNGASEAFRILSEMIAPKVQSSAESAPTVPASAAPLSAPVQNAPMKKCVNARCEKPMPVNAKFCAYCGTKWQNLNLVSCPHCKSEIPGNSSYCPYCENELK
jgi:serine/threonine protein kinase